jgi:AraC-like DNA-binding protein
VNPPAPQGALASFVRGYSVRALDGGDAYVMLPNGEVELVVQKTAGRALVHVLGTRSERAVKAAEANGTQAIVVRFRPGGAYPFFGVSLAELTDRGVPIDAVWGAEGARLREALAEAPSPVAAIATLERALTARLRSRDLFEPASARVVRQAVRRIAGEERAPRVEELARDLGMSPRQLRRAFDEVVGVGPKAFARIVRFQRALAAARGPAAPDWGAIAARVGYYDQAHLIGDFRSLAGQTPGALLRA